MSEADIKHKHNFFLTHLNSLETRMSEADIKDEDFRAYLASSSDEDDEEEEQGNIYGGGGANVSDQGQAGAGSQRSSKEEAKAQKAKAAGSLRDYYR